MASQHVRPIDTSSLGPIRVQPRQSERAREAYADAILAQGPGYRNAADSIRAGWANVWVEAGIRAIEATLKLVPADE